eukprot:344670-Chlamydomonas_euryale.AAC.1
MHQHNIEINTAAACACLGGSPKPPTHAPAKDGNKHSSCVCPSGSQSQEQLGPTADNEWEEVGPTADNSCKRWVRQLTTVARGGSDSQ